MLPCPRVFTALLVALFLAPAVRTQTATDLDALRHELQQPGPEARVTREAAIESLLSRRDAAAHAVLQEFVRRGADEDGVAFTVLSQLRRKLANPTDPVFGNGDKDRSVARSYVPALAALFARPAEGGAAERDLREEARQCLAALQPADRKRAIEGVLRSGDAELRRGGLLLAGASRDLGLAPLIAEWLEVSEAADTAREALARLTFVESFTGLKAFEEWWRANQGRSYIALAEEAAWRAREVRSAALRHAEQRVATVLGELIEALADRDVVAWAAIAERVLADDPPGTMRIGLERLRAVLARGRRHGGSAPDRLAFLAELLDKLAAGPNAEQRALLLEVCAYLVAPGEEKQAEEVTEMLRAGLEHESIVVRRAAALGLARFPGLATTQLLVQAGTRARAAGEDQVLIAVLNALAAPERSAPDADPETFPAWLGLVGSVLRDADAAEPLREAALAVLGQKGSDGKLLGQAFTVLVEVAQNQAQTPFTRERAAVMLLPHAQADAGAADTCLQTLVALLEDPEKRLRLKATQLLQNLPKYRDVADRWRTHVFAAAGERLTKETDEAVLRGLITCIERQVDPEKPDLEPVISRLCTALQELHQAGSSGIRRQILVSALAGQAATQGLDTMKWVRAAETLVELGERREVCNVLDRQRPLNLRSRAGVDKKTVVRALRVLLATALLKPRTEPWPPRELGDVLAAFEYLDEQKAETDTDALRLLRIEALAAAGRWDEVLERGKQEVKDGRLTPAEVERVRLALARAHLARQEIDEAIKLSAEGVPSEPASVALAEDIGSALLRAGRPKDALAWLVQAQQQTPETDPAFPRRFLRRLDAEGQAEPETRSAVLSRLMAKESMFLSPDVPADLKVEFEQVKGRLSGKL